MSNQTRWTNSRRQYYAEMFRQRRPWELGGVKTLQGRRAVRFNKVQTGKQSAPVLTVRRLLSQTIALLRLVNGFGRCK